MSEIEFYLSEEERKNIAGSFSIPEGVTKIGKDAFRDCTGLTEVHIPDSVTEIGEGAFLGCTGLTEVHIPDSVTEIGWEVFLGCEGLTEVHIPDTVTEIGYQAFCGCRGLTEIHIPNSVEQIGSEVFFGCTNLKHIVIPDNPNFHLGRACIPQGCEITKKTEVRSLELSLEDKSILKNLFYDWVRSALIKNGSVPLTEIPHRCRNEFDNAPIPNVRIDCVLTVKDVSGKPELYLVPKGETMPIGALRKYIDPNGKVLTQAINADLKKTTQKTQEQNKNIAEDPVTHKIGKQ